MESLIDKLKEQFEKDPEGMKKAWDNMAESDKDVRTGISVDKFIKNAESMIEYREKHGLDEYMRPIIVFCSEYDEYRGLLFQDIEQYRLNTGVYHNNFATVDNYRITFRDIATEINFHVTLDHMNYGENFKSKRTVRVRLTYQASNGEWIIYKGVDYDKRQGDDFSNLELIEYTHTLIDNFIEALYAEFGVIQYNTNPVLIFDDTHLVAYKGDGLEIVNFNKTSLFSFSNYYTAWCRIPNKKE